MVIPRLTPNLKSGEFKQYYFLKEELKDFCRQEGLKVTGNKGDLEKRIIHYLDTGEKLTEPAIKNHLAEKPSEITLDSEIGENFKCSEDKRKFFVNEIGENFKFKVRFQKWLKSNPDMTYSDALRAYHDIQNSKEKREIAEQFQYNQYIREFFNDNKNRTLDDAVKCWKYKKSLKGSNCYEKTDLVVL